MNSSHDAYGMEIYAHYRGSRIPEVVERDDGLIDPYCDGSSPYFAEYRDWPAYEKAAIKLARGRVLDIGSGAGRVELYLQSIGIDVTGIDVSPLALKVCRLRGAKRVMRRSITEVGKFAPDSFDAVVMFGNNFGLFGSPRLAKKLLKDMHRITSGKAVILAESNDPYKTDNPVHLRYHSLNRRRGRMPGQLRIRVRFEDCIGDWFDYLIVSKREMSRIVAGTGWRIKRFIDRRGGSMYIGVLVKA